MLSYSGLKPIYALIFVLLGPIFAFAQDIPAPPVTESVRARDIYFRGQGMAPFCFAFAEEQLLKDATCVGPSCSKLNAAQWKYSIFDIVRAHREIELRDSLPITADSIPTLFEGAREQLPHLERFKSFTAAECTLEKDLFLLNRLYQFNGQGIEFAPLFDALFKFYQVHKSFVDSAASGQMLSTFHLDKTLAILEKLAAQSTNGADFLSRAITYRVCDRQIPLPKHHLQQVTLSDRGLIEKTIDRVLAQHHSVLVSVCAYALGEIKTNDCGGHVVTLKELNDDQYLVVDSAFFSERPRQSDGSIYIPKAVVLDAIQARAGSPQPQAMEMGVAPQLVYDLMLSQGFDTAANYILDSWRNPGHSRMATLQAFRGIVLEPTLVHSKLTDADKKYFRDQFASVKLQSPAQVESARRLLYAFMASIHDDGLTEIIYIKKLSEGPWLNSLADHADLSRPSPNIAWFD